MSNLLERLNRALGDRYRVEAEIGRGGMALVFLAHDLKHDRRVAIKVLRPELAPSIGTDRFLREIRIAAQLQHPHILALYDSGDADGLLYYVMPYVEGESLRQRLQREKQLQLEDVLRITAHVAEALAHAHSYGVVHRDIKPENILLVGDHALVADFGVARALSAAGTVLTDSGVAVGTPSYMSPEQAAGATDVDARSDIYSLACVVFEMLGGEPPFTGVTPRSVLARHVSERPPSVRVIRPTVPEGLERALEQALAKVPADRPSTVLQFIEAVTLRARQPSDPLSSARVGVATVVAAVVIAVPVALALWSRGPALPPLDASLYVVLPFQYRGDSSAILSGDASALLMRDALTRWTDIRVADALRVHDLRIRRGEGPLTYDEALEIGRTLGAGSLVWGQIWTAADSLRVVASLYDLAGPDTAIRERVAHVDAALTDLGAKFNALADSLLLGASTNPSGSPGAVGTSSLRAWREYNAGYTALQRWDLEQAAKHLRSALASDRDYGSAVLWLAHVLSWSGRPPGEWAPLAVRADAARRALPPRERVLAAGLTALGEGRNPDACRHYRELLTADSADFAGWFGLGECQTEDRLVVRDPTSISGYQFRSSYHAGIEAYRRAFEIVPSFGLALLGSDVNRFTRLFYTSTHRVRQGYALGPDTVWYWAFPRLQHDTLAFVPYPRERMMLGSGGAQQAAETWTAVERNRHVLRSITAEWVRAFPHDPRALELHAAALEEAGSINVSDAPQLSALDLTRRAIGLAPTDRDRLRLKVAEVRLLLKMGAFPAAAARADSLLAGWTALEPEEAAQLAAVAVLRGRVNLAARLSVRAPPSPLFSSAGIQAGAVAPPLVDVGRRLMVYAAVGGPWDSVTMLLDRMETLLETLVAPDRRGRVRQALLDAPAVYLFPQFGTQLVHRADSLAYLLDWQWRLARGDSAWVRAALDDLQAMRTSVPPGDVSIVSMLPEVQTVLLLGDTTLAVAMLDRALNALPLLQVSLTDDVRGVAAVVRAMALRARLAAAAGDRRTTRRWAAPVVTLWADGDAVAARVAAEMRALMED